MSNGSPLDSTNLLKNLDVNTFFLEIDMTCEAPAHRVWHRMLRYHEWNPRHIGAKVERLAGAQNEEGEIILEYLKSGDGYAPPQIIETVKIIPNQKIVWALYSPDSGAANGIGFVEFCLHEMDGKTRFTYRCNMWFNSSVIGKNKQDFLDATIEALKPQNAALKAFVEKGK